MARRIVSITTITPVGYADTTNMTNSTFPFYLQGGSSTQNNLVWEVSISGQAQTSSSPTYMLLSRDSLVAATSLSSGTGLTDASINPATVALAAPPVTGNLSTTLPQRSATLHLANASLNAFGGVYFWRANRMEECFVTLGNTASFGEVSLSAFTGGSVGAIGCHMIYEPL